MSAANTDLRSLLSALREEVAVEQQNGGVQYLEAPAPAPAAPAQPHGGAVFDSLTKGLALGIPRAVGQLATLGQGAVAAYENPAQAIGHAVAGGVRLAGDPMGTVTGVQNPTDTVAGLARDAAGAIDEGVAKLGYVDPAGNPLYDALGQVRSAAGGVTQVGEQFVDPRAHQPFTPEGIAYSVGGSLPQMGVSMVGAVGGGMVGGPAGAFLGAFTPSMLTEASSITDETFRRLKEQNPGMSDEEALTRAFGTGLVAATPAALLDAGTGGEGAIVRAATTKAIAEASQSMTRRVLRGGRDIARAMLEESLTEPIQGTIEEAGQAAAAPVQGPITLQDLRAFFERRGAEAVVGGIMGAGGGTVGAIQQGVREPGAPTPPAQPQAAPPQAPAPTPTPTPQQPAPDLNAFAAEREAALRGEEESAAPAPLEQVAPPAPEPVEAVAGEREGDEGEGQAAEPTTAAGRVVGFKTSQGSTYEYDGSTTRRTKSKHFGHDPNDVGLKERSLRTVFVSPDHANKIGFVYGLNKEAEPRLVFEGDKIILTRKYGKGPNGEPYGKTERTEIPWDDTPAVGKSPIEFWSDGLHPGNEIVELTTEAPAPAASTAAPTFDQQIDTALGASEREEIAAEVAMIRRGEAKGYEALKQRAAENPKGWQAERVRQIEAALEGVKAGPTDSPVLTPDQYETAKLPPLRRELKRRGLGFEGTREELVRRLRESDGTSDPSPAPELPAQVVLGDGYMAERMTPDSQIPSNLRQRTTHQPPEGYVLRDSAGNQVGVLDLAWDEVNSLWRPRTGGHDTEVFGQHRGKGLMRRLYSELAKSVDIGSSAETARGATSETAARMWESLGATPEAVKPHPHWTGKHLTSDGDPNAYTLRRSKIKAPTPAGPEVPATPSQEVRDAEAQEGRQEGRAQGLLSPPATEGAAGARVDAPAAAPVDPEVSRSAFWAWAERDKINSRPLWKWDYGDDSFVLNIGAPKGEMQLFRSALSNALGRDVEPWREGFKLTRAEATMLGLHVPKDRDGRPLREFKKTPAGASGTSTVNQTANTTPLPKRYFRGLHAGNANSVDQFLSASREVAANYAAGDGKTKGKVQIVATSNLPKNLHTTTDKEALAEEWGIEGDWRDLGFDAKAKAEGLRRGFEGIRYTSGTFDADEVHVFGKAATSEAQPSASPTTALSPQPTAPQPAAPQPRATPEPPSPAAAPAPATGSAAEQPGTGSPGSAAAQGSAGASASPESSGVVEQLTNLWLSFASRTDIPADRTAIQGRTVPKILDAIQTGRFNDMLRPDNRVSRQVFEKVTLKKLPPSLKATQAMFTGQPFAMPGLEGADAKRMIEHGATIAPAKAAPEPVARGANKWGKEIGKNAKGQDLREDARGVRSYYDNGWHTESVALVPSRSGMGFSTGPRGPEYLTQKEATNQNLLQAGQQQGNVIIGTVGRESSGMSPAAEAESLRRRIKTIEESQIPGWEAVQDRPDAAKNIEALKSELQAKKARLVSIEGTPATPAASTGFLSNLSPEKQARAAELAAKLKAKLNNELRSGFDPEILAIGAEYGALYFEAGVKRFADFARKMVAEVGPAIKPYLKGIYMGARNMPGVDKAGLDKADYVEELSDADIEAFTAGASENTGQPPAPTEIPSPESGEGGTVTTGGSNARSAPDRGKQPDGAPAGEQPVLPGTAGAPEGTPDTAGAAPEQGEPAPAPAPAGDGEQGGEGSAAADAAGRKPRGGRRGGSARRGGAGNTEPRVDAGGGPAEPGPVESSPKVRDLDAQPAPDVRDLNHKIGPDDVIAPSGQIAKIKGNVRAIELLKKLEAANRNPTPEEKKVLAQYVGFGPIGEVVNRVKAELWERYLERVEQYKERGWGDPDVDDDVKSWADKYYDSYKRIREAVSRSEFEAITHSTRNAHYTGKNIIENGIWPVVQRLGFTGGNVLETSAGIGHMIGLMPESLRGTSKWTAVELDSLSSRILTKLYPEANVINSRFEEAPLKRNVFDLVVGNVPFARDKVRTEEGYPDFSLHNYFLAKSIDMLRPGGLMVAISSTSSMDAEASRNWREWMNQRADLVGAIRLPNNAFIQSANAAVTTDILIFRKRDATAFAERQDFSYTVQVDTGEKGKAGQTIEPIPLNIYYHNHPEMLLGKMSAMGEMYGGVKEDRAQPTMNPTPGAIEDKLKAAVGTLPQNIMGEQGGAAAEVVEAAPGTKMYAVYQDEKGQVLRRTPDGAVALKGAEAKLAKQYVGLRDSMLEVVRAQINEATTDADLDKARANLKKLYDGFVKDHGLINKRRRGEAAFIEDDPDFNKVAALETVEFKAVQKGTTKSGKPKYVLEPHIKPAQILTQRTQWPFKEPDRADSLRDAIAVSEFFRGSLQLPYVAKLVGMDEAGARKSMLAEGLVFVDPESGQIVPRAAYLSGNIKAKLDLARKNAETDATYTLNVEALEALLPATVPISKIRFRMGATWIPEAVYAQFAEDLFGRNSVSIVKTATGQWSVRVNRATTAEGVANAKKYGTVDFSGLEVFKAVLEVEPLIAYDRVATESGTSTRKNPERSAQAETMADILREKFLEWAKTSEAATTIADSYNTEFNGMVPRKYDPPPYAHFPGASQTIKLRDYQRSAVMRGVFGSYLNAHEVGLGKTFTAISTAMEWRRLGLARKPLLVVQPSTYLQFAASFNQLYPSANVLVPTEADAKPENRKRLVNRIVTGDWDAIVIPQTMFNRIKVSPDFAEDFIHGEIDALTQAAADAVENDGKRSPTAKKLQEQIDALDAYLDKLKSGRDADMLYLDELGIDGLIVDEAHDYKNSYFRTAYTQLKGVNPKAADRSLDMLLKTRYIQQKVGAGRHLVGLTGTPVSNTIGEAWVMMRYFRPDVLERNHLTNFDDFAGAFADISAKEEMDATNRYKPQLRMRAFTNVRQFQAIWSEVVDVIRYDDLPEAERGKINRPPIKGGKPQLIELEPTKDVLKIMRGLIARYEWFENLKGKARYQNRHVPGQINTMARKVSIDARMHDPTLPDDPASKVNRAVDEIFKRWESGKDQGMTQVVFSDLYRDNPDTPRFNVFEDIRKKLIARGVPENEVVIALDLTDAARAAIFQKVNEGAIRIIMGSTQKLGVGVNIQTRLFALHHLDAPYRPMDMEQREGRIVRFGNLTVELTGDGVEILRYGVKKTFDAGQYERLSRKQRAVNDTLSGRATEDEVEGAGEEMALSFAEASAAFSGDPDVLRKVELDNEIKRLEAVRASHIDALEDLNRRVREEQRRQRDLSSTVAKRRAWVDAHGAAFEGPAVVKLSGVEGEITGEDLNKRVDEWVKATMERTRKRGEEGSSPRVREDAGNIVVHGVTFPLVSTATFDGEGAYMQEQSGVYVSAFPEGMSAFGQGRTYRSGRGLVESIVYEGRAVRESIETAEQGAKDAAAREVQWKEQLGKLTFDQQAELDAAKKERDEVMARLRAKKQAEESAGSAAQDAPAEMADVGAVEDEVGEVEPDDDGGPTSAPGDASQPSRFADRLNNWADERITRAHSRLRGGPDADGIVWMGSGVDPMPLIDLGFGIAAKALARGLNSKSGRALTAFVTEQLEALKAQGFKKLPAVEVDRARAIVRSALKDAGDDGQKLIANYAAERERAERRRTREAAKAGGVKPAEVRGAVAEQVLERPEVKSRVAKQVREAQKEGARAERRAAEVGVRGLIGTVRRQKAALASIAAIERRGGKAEAQAEQAVRDSIRKQATDYARTLPPEVRGKLLGAITSATSPLQYVRALRGLQRELARRSARMDWKWLKKATAPKRIRTRKGMTDDLRRSITALRGKARGLYEEMQGKDVSLTRLAEISNELADIRNRVGVGLKTSAALYRRLDNARKETAQELAHRLAQSISTREAKDNPDEEADVEPAGFLRVWSQFSDIRNAAARIDPSGILERLMWDRFERAEEKMFTREREMHTKLADAFRRAGFENLAAAERAMTGYGGRGVTTTVKAKLGGQERTITLGDAVALLGHQSDPMTNALINAEDGQGFQSQRGRFRHEFTPTPDEVDALAEQVDPDGKYRRLVQDIKDVMEELRPETFRTHFVLKGFEPEVVDGRWPRPRNLQASGAAQLPEHASDLVHRFLENDGMFEARVQTTGAPIVLMDPVTMALDQIDRSLRTIYLAMPTRDAANVLLHPGVREAMASRHGPSTYTSIKRHLMMISRADRVLGTGGARAASILNSVASTSSIGGNPGTWLVTAASAVRLWPWIGTRAMLDGIKGLPSVTMDDLTNKSGFFFDRYEGHHAADRFSAVVNGTPSPNPEGKVGADLSAAVANIKGGDLKAGLKDLQRASRGMMGVLNWFDALNPRLAWAGLDAMLERRKPEWSRAKRDRWLNLKVRRLIRENQGGSSPIDQAIGPAGVRDSGASVFTLFTSEPFKTRNRITRAFRQSKTFGAKVLAAEVLSVTLGLAARKTFWLSFSAAVAAMFGLDEEDEERLAQQYLDADKFAIDAGREFADVVVPFVGRNVFDAFTSPVFNGGDRVIDAPAFSVVEEPINEARRAYSTMSKAMEDEANAGQVAVALGRFLNAAGASAGINPFQPVLRRVLNEAWEAAEE